MAEHCSGCMTDMKSSFVRRHNCTVCGDLVCDGCSSRDLIVFIPDADERCESTGNATAKLAIIKVVGVLLFSF